MKNRATSIIIAIVASSMLMMLTAMIAAPVLADITSEPHNADAMWVTPSNQTIIDHTQVGAKFNVTVWMNITESVFAYQIGLRYNRTLLTCTRAGYTNGSTSAFFLGHTTSSPPPVIDISGTLGNGSILAFETLLGADQVTGPHADSLMWAEFQILNFTMPPSGNLTAKFDITTSYASGDTWVEDTTLANINLPTLGNGNLIIIPEFAQLLILPILMTATLAAIVLSKKRPIKKLN